MLITDDQLAYLLLQSKVLDEAKLNAAKSEVSRTNRNLETVLLDGGIVPDEELGKIMAKQLNCPFVELAKINVPESNFRILPERVARKQHVVIFDRDKTSVKVAMNNPTREDIIAMIAKKTGLEPAIFYATKKDIEQVLSLFKPNLQKTIDILLNEEAGRTRKAGLDDPPVARIVELLLNTAYEERASDIHIEPQEKDTLIRFRIDGILQETLRLSKLLHERILTRLKVMSNLRTDEHLAAQDGKMKVVIEDERVDIRVSIIPVVDGEKAVLRLLAAKSRQFSLTDLGMTDTDLEKVKRAYSKSYGMILSTGPTGSGKTTSIYAILKILNRPEKNITSVEDPVEYRISGANQIQVNTKTNLTFANGLRSILRQDPNIVFVGEIRDNETAGIAVNAALTGHLVLSTLHTNDAATALPRLIDMKVEPFLVSSTVTVIIAQRLVRKVCQACRVAENFDRTKVEEMFGKELVEKIFGNGTEIKLYRGQGCKVCRGAGYNGRIGLFEVLEVNAKIRKLIVEKVDSDVLSAAAIAEGMTPMAVDGLKKVAEGLTTTDELLRVTKADFI